MSLFRFQNHATDPEGDAHGRVHHDEEDQEGKRKAAVVVVPRGATPRYAEYDACE